MRNPNRNDANSEQPLARRLAGSAGEPDNPAAAVLRAGRLRPASRRLDDVLAERGPLTGPITDAGTRALMAVRGEVVDGEHGKP